MAPVEGLHVPLPETFHQKRRALCFHRAQQQVHVVAHEHVRMDTARNPAGHLLEHRKVEAAIGFGREARRLVDSALHDMEWKSDNALTRGACHAFDNDARTKASTSSWGQTSDRPGSERGQSGG